MTCALIISTSGAYDLFGIVMSESYKSMNQREPLEMMYYPILFSLLSGLIFVTERHDLSHSVCHVQSLNHLCLNSIGFPY